MRVSEKKPMGRWREEGWVCHKSVWKGYRYILAHHHAQINSTVRFFFQDKISTLYYTKAPLRKLSCILNLKKKKKKIMENSEDHRHSYFQDDHWYQEFSQNGDRLGKHKSMLLLVCLLFLYIFFQTLLQKLADSREGDQTQISLLMCERLDWHGLSCTCPKSERRKL